ncbi:MAG: hypothetical protein ACREIV_12240, partial [Planctomycetaceae bacterium]
MFSSSMRFRFGLPAVVAAVLVVSSAADARANVNLRAEMEIVAEQISKFLKSEDEDSIVIGSFTAERPQLASSGGVSIAQMLAEELKKHDIEIKRRSR